jgi:hypothetical protein
VADFINVKLLGGQELQNMLNKLPEKAQKKVVRQSLRKSTKRIHGVMTQKLSGFPVMPQTGRLLIAMSGKKPKMHSRRDVIRYGIPLPTRDELGIPEDDRGYYPTAVEYGHDLVRGGRVVGHVPPHSYMRAAVDENVDTEFRQIGADLGKGIPKEAARLARKARG